MTEITEITKITEIMKITEITEITMKYHLNHKGIRNSLRISYSDLSLVLSNFFLSKRCFLSKYKRENIE